MDHTKRFSRSPSSKNRSHQLSELRLDRYVRNGSYKLTNNWETTDIKENMNNESLERERIGLLFKKNRSLCDKVYNYFKNQYIKKQLIKL